MSSPSSSMRSRFEQWLHERADETVLRGLFAAMLGATATVLVLDYGNLSKQLTDRMLAAPAVRPLTHTQPLPSVERQGSDERPALPRRAGQGLETPMGFELVDGGRLLAIGTIEPGTAERFAAEVAKRGAYVKTVVLHSPGGSVSDALEMGRLIRAKKFATEVESGRYCASSCPLVFAGGMERRAGAKASIGVHQIYAASRESLTVAGGMDNAQRVSAQCQKHLREMDIDLQVWVHAMETPKERLYYFKPDELLALRLVTPLAASASRAPS